MSKLATKKELLRDQQIVELNIILREKVTLEEK